MAVEVKHASMSGWVRRLLCAVLMLVNAAAAAAPIPSSEIWNSFMRETEPLKSLCSASFAGFLHRAHTPGLDR
ncbi:MAG: hypothetical protein ACYCZD_10115 [Rhodanobacter sp.]